MAEIDLYLPPKPPRDDSASKADMTASLSLVQNMLNLTAKKKLPRNFRHYLDNLAGDLDEVLSENQDQQLGLRALIEQTDPALRVGHHELRPFDANMLRRSFSLQPGPMPKPVSMKRKYDDAGDEKRAKKQKKEKKDKKDKKEKKMKKETG
eukprot:TRINITY_DN60_c0_g1_i1.p1 TRINITY_DN60_c0_g1~~TRINITY_DN60_c0_g1_i1.p1  ORF type:complete len:151 (-),score=27.52 TRINITY_DN60_c0_g1_i1:53-505(-)